MNAYIKKLWRGYVMRRNFYSQNGITLLALILTVVIMIILAAVTINVTLGERRLGNSGAGCGGDDE